MPAPSAHTAVPDVGYVSATARLTFETVLDLPVVGCQVVGPALLRKEIAAGRSPLDSAARLNSQEQVAVEGKSGGPCCPFSLARFDVGPSKKIPSRIELSIRRRPHNAVIFSKIFPRSSILPTHLPTQTIGVAGRTRPGRSFLWRLRHEAPAYAAADGLVMLLLCATSWIARWAGCLASFKGCQFVPMETRPLTSWGPRTRGALRGPAVSPRYPTAGLPRASRTKGHQRVSETVRHDAQPLTAQPLTVARAALGGPSA